MKKIVARVTGEVQGVWFRASARQEARRLGVTGYVRNLSDGSVEILAQGGDLAVDALVDWAHHGPEQAAVMDVLVSDYDGDDLYLDFEITD
ncbi:acylphosphatase [Ferrimonas balearica DSM 9799]|uniref:Acylphosphatase n=1 Tax=Ferrimonas balearica (strain DSM 9799 / CCM 4581 / KCTC 23876 / PAT) TaxID=550540 RepID=E1SNP3_FERBD|nr:acylphosphatase [Ferrimonas balearica]MBY6018468.1 acylphosphatase [Halomonas denitrificans]ADN76716.1 acylphosphatase [Ferrimonas balearica DSM 9799]MBW3140297.1 acylphosphatase [Ferrimonas balearica]MBW3166307.1 acylphosphatase [Ferrimonas balearica]MBY5979819.1 acylphosphatase [Ferrimonas balearica]